MAVKSSQITNFEEVAKRLELSAMLNLAAGDYSGVIASPKKGIHSIISPEKEQKFQTFEVAKLQMMVENKLEFIPVDANTLIAPEGSTVNFRVEDYERDGKTRKKVIIISVEIPENEETKEV